MSKKIKWSYFEQKLIYNDRIKILSPVISFAFLMWCICGVFFQKWINQANKRLFDSYRVSKNGKWPYFGVKIDDQNIAFLKKFAFVMRMICGQTKLIQYFDHIHIQIFACK